MTQPSSGLWRLTNGNSDTLDIALPNYPYGIQVSMAIDTQKLDDGSFDSFDNGTSYDKRSCELSFDLSATQALALNAWVRTAGASYMRAATGTLELATDSGFFPFGPDKTPEGPFTVAVEITEPTTIQESPFKLFRVSMRVFNTGVYPAYVLPTEVDEGVWSFGSVTALRFPPRWFRPSSRFAYSIAREEDGSVQFIDRGTGGDAYTSSIEMVCSENKAAALLSYITGTVRTNTFVLTSIAGMYPFGRDLGDGAFTVSLTSPEFEVTHEQYNRFRLSAEVSYVSGPA